MIIIKEAYKEIQMRLGCQNYKEDNAFHVSVFVVKESTPKGDLLYNTLTGEIILTESEDDAQELKKKWYYISNENDEFLVLEKLRKQLIDSEISDAISTYTIFPTTDCNASCYYCFEEGRKKKNMNKATAVKVAAYISGKCKNNEVTIRWFGGEPLVNKMAIDIVCSLLKEKDISFTSKMVTNGFLFSKSNIEKACKNWHLTQVQITIDGTESQYNKIKNYNCSKDINPFCKVLNNIDLLTSKGVYVIIRLNVCLDNIADQINLCKTVLLTRFKNNNQISIYSHLLLESLVSGTVCEHKKLFGQKEILDDLIYNNGFSCHNKASTKFKLYRCVSDNKKSVTILPNGEIGLCEHYSDNHFVTHIDSSSPINSGEVNFLRARLPKLELCSDCSFYPFCIRLKCCPEHGTCTPELKGQYIRNLHRELIAEYESYLHKMEIQP